MWGFGRSFRSASKKFKSNHKKSYTTSNDANLKRRGKRWLTWLALGGFTAGSLYIGDAYINDDLDLITDRFRRKLSPEERKNRPKLVILGAGWGALNMLRKIHSDKFDVTVISPRNYFLFTPLLPSTSSGTVSVSSITEPIRNFLTRGSQEAKFIELEATDIDPVAKKVHCVDTSAVKGKVSEIDIDYDYLVVAVGAETATFNIPGVKENSIFMKSIEDSQLMRRRVLDCFETSVIPGQPEEEIERLLHFVVVGGGPSGVECTAELHDFVKDDLKRAFPQVANKVKISLIEALPNILPMFDKSLIEYAEKKLKVTNNVNVMTKSAVTKVAEQTLTIKDADGNIQEVPYGCLLWVAGNAPRKIVTDLINKLGPEHHPIRRGLNVNNHLQVNGADGIFAIGDASVCGRLAPTAQVATQEGNYLARLFNNLADDMHQETLKRREGENANILAEKLNESNAFNYKHYGAFAYVGDNRAIADLTYGNIKSYGYSTFLFWRSVYFSKLLSSRNRVYVLYDWFKSTVFGRDISRG